MRSPPQRPLFICLPSMFDGVCSIASNHFFYAGVFVQKSTFFAAALTLLTLSASAFANSHIIGTIDSVTLSGVPGITPAVTGITFDDIAPGQPLVASSSGLHLGRLNPTTAAITHLYTLPAQPAAQPRLHRRRPLLPDPQPTQRPQHPQPLRRHRHPGRHQPQRHPLQLSRHRHRPHHRQPLGRLRQQPRRTPRNQSRHWRRHPQRLHRRSQPGRLPRHRSPRKFLHLQRQRRHHQNQSSNSTPTP